MLLGTLLLGVAAAAPLRAQVPDAEARFAQRIDEARRAHGLGAYAPAADLQAVARQHAARMAARGEPYHNPALSSEVHGWEELGENVGVGYSADSLHDRFMASNVHRSTILSTSFSQVGIGVVQGSDGRLWVAQVFRRPAAAHVAPAAALPAPPPEPAPAPAVPSPAPAPAAPATPAPPSPAPPSPAPPPAAPRPAAPPPPPAPAPAQPGDAGELAADRPAPAPVVEAAAARATLPVGVPDDVVPPAAAGAALLLAATVGGQGLVLRRLGLVG